MMSFEVRNMIARVHVWSVCCAAKFTGFNDWCCRWYQQLYGHLSCVRLYLLPAQPSSVTLEGKKKYNSLYLLVIEIAKVTVAYVVTNDKEDVWRLRCRSASSNKAWYDRKHSTGK